MEMNCLYARRMGLLNPSLGETNASYAQTD
jgi:hypothetical protein